jgi:thiamine pyrophosphokinase
MGQTCGILPVGVRNAYVQTRHLKWNLGKSWSAIHSDATRDWTTSFDGDVSTSNHLLPSEPVVYLKTDNPVLWCVEVKGTPITSKRILRDGSQTNPRRTA